MNHDEHSVIRPRITHPVQEPAFDRFPWLRQTTVLERVVEHLGDYRLAGFLTLALQEHGQRVGFEAVGLGGRRVILAHVRFRSLVSVGRFGVEPDRLVPLIEEELARTHGKEDAYVIDEIGKMECHCPQFIRGGWAGRARPDASAVLLPIPLAGAK